MALMFSSKPASVSEVILEEHFISEHKRTKFVLRKFFLGIRPLGAVASRLEVTGGKILDAPIPR